MNKIFTFCGIILSGCGLIFLGGCFQTQKIITSASCLQPPTPVAAADNTTLLVYEIYLVNEQGEDGLTLEKIEISNPEAIAAPLAVYQGEKLLAACLLVTEDIRTKKQLDTFQSLKFIRKMTKNDNLLKKGMGVIVFLWIELGNNQPAPKKLSHRILFTKSAPGAQGRQQLIGSFGVSVLNNKPVVIAYPLRGKNWVASGALGPGSSHRRAILAMNGNFFLAQRFAVDWIMLDNLGKLAGPDIKDNNSFFGFGAEVLSVADGTVVSISDGIPENIPGTKPALKKIEQAQGNNVVVDIGGGHYVSYAQLQPGSLRVKPDDKVRRGQVLGLLGNTGNSDAPHLHMHVSNGPDPVRSEGLPFVFDSFQLRGIAASEPNITKATWRWRRKKIPLEAKEIIPLQNYVVGFPERNNQ